MSTGQWMHPTIGAPWFFEAGAESLDFAYTGELGGTATAGERLHSPADLGAWLAEHVGHIAPGDASERDLADALILRGALTRLHLASADGAAGSSATASTIAPCSTGCCAPGSASSRGCTTGRTSRAATRSRRWPAEIAPSANRISAPGRKGISAT